MIRKLFLGAAGVATLTSCGQDHGYAYQAKSVAVADSLGERPDFELSKSSYKDAVWFMGCDATDTAPTPQPAQLVISGNSFNAVRENFQGTKMIFQGRVCPPITYARDVVFLIDVSGSMWYPDVDPMVNGSCKRLTQLESMIAGLPAGSQFSVVAFEEIIAASSTKYYDTKAGLYAELTQNGAKPIADIICGASGVSDFDVGMNAAKALMAKGRPGQIQKELVIMTDGDGEGNTSHSTAGLAVATDLKTKGINVGSTNYKVQVAGLRIGSRDQLLGQAASADMSGTAMVDDIAQSAGINGRLNAFTLGILANAKITYGPAGSGQAISIDLKPQLAADYTFHVENGPLVLDRGQTGYEATINYADTRGNAKTVTAKLNWVPAP